MNAFISFVHFILFGFCVLLDDDGDDAEAFLDSLSWLETLGAPSLLFVGFLADLLGGVALLGPLLVPACDTLIVPTERIAFPVSSEAWLLVRIDCLLVAVYTYSQVGFNRTS